ncbi:MAG: helix-turn-helix domain-containing protein, partial [Chitinophagales bacterium]
LSDENAQHLFGLLKQIRWQFVHEENVAPFMVCHDSSLREMATYLPQSFNDMAMIKGMGDRSLKKYGEAFLTAIQNFSRENGLPSRMHLKEEDLRQAKISKKNKPAEEGDTKTRSFQLFQSGKTIEEIAASRGMAVSTIEGHLSFFVKSGELDVFSFVSEEKFEMINEALKSLPQLSLSAVKNMLGESVTYSEIRFVLAANDFRRGQASA